MQWVESQEFYIPKGYRIVEGFRYNNFKLLSPHCLTFQIMGKFDEIGGGYKTVEVVYKQDIVNLALIYDFDGSGEYDDYGLLNGLKDKIIELWASGL